MSDPSLGIWLRRERERRGITLRSIADQTKVAAPLLEGLEADDLSRWPGGIYRRGFVRSYAAAIGLDADEVVKRFEQEHGASVESGEGIVAAVATAPLPSSAPAESGAAALAAPAHASSAASSKRSRVFGTLADLTVALVLGLASAAAGSRLLWPVLLIAAYYSIGVLLTGTSPMVALLKDESPGLPAPSPQAQPDQLARASGERRHKSRRGNRPIRSSRASRARVQ